MKINVTKHELLNRLRVVSKVIKHNHQQAAYSSFMIETTGDDEITITGTEDAGRIETTLLCKIEDPRPMKFLVDGKTFMDGLKELPDMPLTIEVKDTGQLVVKYHTGKYELPYHDADAYPIPFGSDNKTDIEINHALLVRAFKSTMKFASADELRPIMMNVNIEFKNGNLSFAGSNGMVLSIFEEYNEKLELPEFSVNVPARAIKIITDVMQPNEEVSIPISYNHNNITFIVDGYTITYRLTEGRYPNIHSVIPKNSDRVVKVNRADLIAAIGRVSIFASDHSSLILFTTKGNDLILKSEDIDFARGATETIELTDEQDDFTIGFKSSFLSEILRTMEEEICEFHLSTPDRAALIKPKGNESATFILMPMQINN